MLKTDIAVIGGGPAGMMAAIEAAEAGAKVILLEKKEKVGRKLLVTGRGRCNIGNKNMGHDHYHCNVAEFVKKVFSASDPAEALDTLSDAGIRLKTDDKGRIFPITEEASAVLDILRMELDRLSVREQCAFSVRSIKKSGDEFIIKSDNEECRAKRVIIATGGRSYPKLGAEGDGYRLAKDFGHNIIKPMPALVHLRSDAAFLKRISGVKIEGVAELRINKQTILSYSGEILFTDYGLSGIPILQLSRLVNEALDKGDNAVIVLYQFPRFSKKELNLILKSRAFDHPERNISDTLLGILNKKLIPVILEESGIKRTKIPAERLSNEEWQRLIRLLKNWHFTITGSRGWDVAQITAGGVDTREIYPRRMESRIVTGLYFAGEVVDVDGESGGYNLLWAWSSGRLAGQQAAKSLTTRKKEHVK